MIHCGLVVLGIDDPATQVTDAELDVLRRYAVDARTIVELGTFEGKTAVALARVSPGTVYTVDPFMPGRLGVCYGRVIARIAQRRAKAGNLQFLRGFSHDVAPRFDEPVDMLFIDANHSYEAVRRDWEDWTPKLRAGGIVAMHDVRVARNSPVRLGSMDFFEREVAVNEGYEEVAAADALVVMRKRGARNTTTSSGSHAVTM